MPKNKPDFSSKTETQRFHMSLSEIERMSLKMDPGTQKMMYKYASKDNSYLCNEASTLSQYKHQNLMDFIAMGKEKGGYHRQDIERYHNIMKDQVQGEYVLRGARDLKERLWKRSASFRRDTVGTGWDDKSAKVLDDYSKTMLELKTIKEKEIELSKKKNVSEAAITKLNIEKIKLYEQEIEQEKKAAIVRQKRGASFSKAGNYVNMAAQAAGLFSDIDYGINRERVASMTFRNKMFNMGLTGVESRNYLNVAKYGIYKDPDVLDRAKPMGLFKMAQGALGTIGEGLARVGAGIAGGTGIGSVIPGIGTVIGGAIGGTIGLISNNWKGVTTTPSQRMREAHNIITEREYQRQLPGLLMGQRKFDVGVSGYLDYATRGYNVAGLLEETASQGIALTGERTISRSHPLERSNKGPGGIKYKVTNIKPQTYYDSKIQDLYSQYGGYFGGSLNKLYKSVRPTLEPISTRSQAYTEGTIESSLAAMTAGFGSPQEYAKRSAMLAPYVGDVTGAQNQMLNAFSSGGVARQTPMVTNMILKSILSASKYATAGGREMGTGATQILGDMLGTGNINAYDVRRSSEALDALSGRMTNQSISIGKIMAASGLSRAGITGGTVQAGLLGMDPAQIREFSTAASKSDKAFEEVKAKYMQYGFSRKQWLESNIPQKLLQAAFTDDMMMIGATDNIQQVLTGDLSSEVREQIFSSMSESEKSNFAHIVRRNPGMLKAISGTLSEGSELSKVVQKASGENRFATLDPEQENIMSQLQKAMLNPQEDLAEILRTKGMGEMIKAYKKGSTNMSRDYEQLQAFIAASAESSVGLMSVNTMYVSNMAEI
jgi:hypothetical protein